MELLDNLGLLLDDVVEAAILSWLLISNDYAEEGLLIFYLLKFCICCSYEPHPEQYVSERLGFAYCKFHERVYGLLYYFAYEYKKKETDVLSSAIIGYYLLS